jgi:opacity protein-like surface antigen
MKKVIALALLALAFQGVAALAGGPITPSKEVVAPPPPPPASYFRANEWSIAGFGAYGWTWDRNQRGIGNHYWGGGVDGQYFPIEYLGFAVEGTFFNEVPGDTFGATVVGNLIARYPLDLKYPTLHLAPYGFAGIGGLFHSGSDRGEFGDIRPSDSRFQGDFGGGLEYRFTPNIGLFSDVRFNLVDGPKNNYLSTRFGLRYAF